MDINTQKKAEEIAKKMSKENTGTEDMWELFLTEAYSQMFNLNNHE